MLKRIVKILLVVMLTSITLFVFPLYIPTVSANDSTFQIDVKEILSVSIGAPSEWATGNIGGFLRNKINLKVTSNNNFGFTAGMTTNSTSTNLQHVVKENINIPTLSSSIARSNFPLDRWGYSFTDGDNNGTYNPLVGNNVSPITIFKSATASSAEKDIYFGTKSSISKASGTYTGTIVISVVSGTHGQDLVVPSEYPQDPSGPGPEEQAQYDGNNTIYTYTSGNTTTTQISDGNNVSAYDGYTPPQGATDSINYDIRDGSPVVTILTTVASIAAGTGILFFVLAKRKKDDEEETS